MLYGHRYRGPAALAGPEFSRFVSGMTRFRAAQVSPLIAGGVLIVPKHQSSLSARWITLDPATPSIEETTTQRRSTFAP
jgi:hypothetical protein